MVCYADSNGSYDVPEAIKIGRLLEEYKYVFYEEPVPFRLVRGDEGGASRPLDPIAGGEQEASLRTPSAGSSPTMPSTLCSPTCSTSAA
jgi:L-alanine-DL-glutamate epimerase-like enolase superfamily enzyme